MEEVAGADSLEDLVNQLGVWEVWIAFLGGVGVLVQPTPRQLRSAVLVVCYCERLVFRIPGARTLRRIKAPDKLSFMGLRLRAIIVTGRRFRG